LDRRSSRCWSRHSTRRRQRIPTINISTGNQRADDDDDDDYVDDDVFAGGTHGTHAPKLPPQLLIMVMTMMMTMWVMTLMTTHRWELFVYAVM